MFPVRRALISVSNKQGLAEFAAGLHRLGVEIVSTGGTAAFLEENEIPVTRVAEVTGFPEILGGRVKTLHPMIHGGILANRARSSDVKELSEHGITPIDLVAVNLYPFRQTAAAEGAAFEEVIEMIDIGGPCMVRAAAKNFHAVAPVVDPEDYPQVLAALEQSETVPEALRRRLAIKAFRHTQGYDAAISEWMERQAEPSDDEGESEALAPDHPRFPSHLFLDTSRELEPRYGENPHQRAAVYKSLGGPGLLGGMDQLQGKDLSYNNLLDADAARKMVALFDEPTVAILKHNNPCGVGRGDNAAEAYTRALETDPVSAFGSIVALNRPANAELAERMADLFVEVVVAPAFGEGAREVFAAKKNLRLLVCPAYAPHPTGIELRSIDGGLLAQAPDGLPEDLETWTTASTRLPTDDERAALEFAWKVCRYVKSNAIVLTGRDQTVGIGAGQMSRVDSCRLAVEKARLPIEGSVAASDAFFPFRDGLDFLAEAGVKAVIQPGGSKRDEEVMAAADEHDVAMIFTGRRHFRH
ncbi:MAG: bifunctional phosphoribosylaminoimidazolecarboxamide formyltransferase/IMP cyclohydrolase [Acidobacteriota bacterium]